MYSNEYKRIQNDTNDTNYNNNSIYNFIFNFIFNYNLNSNRRRPAEQDQDEGAGV